jgi:hypothetical protein
MKACAEVRTKALGRWLSCATLATLLVFGFAAANAAKPNLACPEIGPLWVRPCQTGPAQPVWGHADGLRVGLWPMPGPRGLLRVYAPYLEHSEDRMLNYLAIEPVVAGSIFRSFSELEWSALDDEQGMRLWSADSPDDPTPRDPDDPARGVISHQDGIEILTVYVFVEPFQSGARVYLRLRFRSDRPYEVGIATHTQPSSATLRTCIVTATMGNYARLRTLYLRDSVRTAAELWPTFEGLDFAPHVCFSVDQLIRTPDGGVLFVTTPNEAHPDDAEYAPGTFIGWKYSGDVATQYWRCENPSDELWGCVNARAAYWASQSPIPGGISFENFELVEPFHEGAEYWFGVEPGLCQHPNVLSPNR